MHFRLFFTLHFVQYTVLFNKQVTKNQYKHIELTEGEIDAITYLTTALKYNLSDS